MIHFFIEVSAIYIGATTIPSLDSLCGAQDKLDKARGEVDTAPVSVKNPTFTLSINLRGKNSSAQSHRHGRGTIACQCDLRTTRVVRRQERSGT